jgi:EAL domain-containing protein (putative c-di-GMP-specific phosphodiesterase class I)
VFDLGFGWFAANFRASPLRLSVNISAKTVMDEAFVESITRRCEGLGLTPDQIICELTETSAMEDPVASLGSLTRLRMKGVHLSIDDLGTGFSSLLLLVRLPFSELKVDKSFVISASRSAESRQVIKAIVGLGQSLDMQTTAEGVEDGETLRFLEEIGCNLAQGFFIARPMPGDEALRWVADYQGSGI